MAAIRGSAGYSRDGLFPRSATQSDQAQVSIEMGNGFDLDTEVDGLRQQVGRLKVLSQAIGDEQNLNSAAAESLEETLERAKLILKKGMRRLNRAFEQSKSNHFLYLVLFMLAAFFALYFVARVRRFLS